MNTLPAPLTPIDCDLRDYQYMPLDVVRLRDSDIAAISSGDEFRSAVLLWCASWHQVPAASLPDDDIVLSQLAGFGRVVKEWKKIREGALRGWVKCSDGRLYHPVVAEKANESWITKLTYHYNKLVDRTRKENKKREDLRQPLVEILPFDDWKSIGMPSNFPDNFQRKTKEIPAETIKQSEGNPAENALKGKVREHKVREDNIKTVLAGEDISHTSPVSPTSQFPMFDDWIPSDSFPSLCKSAGLTAKPTDDQVQEFRTYWLTQPDRQRTQSEWEHALIKSCKAGAARNKLNAVKQNRDAGRLAAAKSIFPQTSEQRTEIEVHGEKLE